MLAEQAMLAMGTEECWEQTAWENEVTDIESIEEMRRKAVKHAAAPGVRYDHVDGEPSQPSGMTYQQRQERLQGLADVFVSIFCSLSPEQRARYMAEDAEQQSQPPNDEHEHPCDRS